MSMIKVENLNFSYPGSYDNVFENVNFQIDTNWKLGFVGRNGRGKTTFLNLLLNKYEYSGKIYSSVKFDYFPYFISDKNRLTIDILTEICPLAEEWQLIRELSYLDVEVDTLWRTFETLSNGEQTKVMLAGLFLNEEHFLLIDEPTNHLDTHARKMVSAYLQKKKGFILVSHDRSFLDGCVDHILSLNKASIEVQSGNFSSWLENFERQQNFERAKNEHLQKDIKRLQESAKRTSVWSDRVEASKIGAADKGFVGHKSAKMMKRAKSTEARQQKAIKEKTALMKNTEINQSLKLSSLQFCSNTLITLSDIEICYSGQKICKPISFTVKDKDRILLDGKNGSGKSSLLKLIVGDSIEHTGTITAKSGIIISYVPQDISHLHGNLTDYAIEHHISETLLKTILRKMDFDRIQFEKDMNNYSDGQKKKVLIAKSLCEQAHLYIWDEPLNFIDIYSRIQIEELLQDFSPTMIFVEHDQKFQEKIATKIVKL